MFKGVLLRKKDEPLVGEGAFQVIDKALEIVNERGWTTGNWGDQGGPVCLEGAVDAAVNELAHARFCQMGRAYTSNPYWSRLHREAMDGVRAVIAAELTLPKDTHITIYPYNDRLPRGKRGEKKAIQILEQAKKELIKV